MKRRSGTRTRAGVQARSASHSPARKVGRKSRSSGRPGGRASRPTSGTGKARPGSRLRRRPGSGRRAAGLQARLAIHVDDGLNRDTAEVELDGLLTHPRKPAAGVFPGVRERESAARRVTRGSDPRRLAGLLAAIAHPQRLAVLLKLLAGEANHKLLIKATCLKAGPLHYHLRELRGAGLIGPKQRDIYSLTKRGRRTILAALAMGRLCRE